MLYILSGEDDFSLKEAIAEIRKPIGELNTTYFNGNSTSREDFEAACATLPFLSEKRLVIAEDLLERLSTTPKDKLKGWLDVIRHLPQTTELVLAERGQVSPREIIPEDITAQTRVFHPLRVRDLKRWVSKRVSDNGGDISPQALDLLVWLGGADLWVMSGEIEKLLLFTCGRRIEEEDVKMLVSESQQITIFELVDAALKGNSAQHALLQLFRSGASPSYILFMLARQVRLLLRMKALEASGTEESEIRRRLSIASDFAWRKTKELSSRYSLGQLKELYRKLLETDRSIKTGQCDGELALHLLVAELH